MFSRFRLSTTNLVALISFFGQLYFFVPFITPYLLLHDLSLAQIAGMQTMLLWAMLVMEVPTGVLADRLGHRWSYTVALALAAAGEGLFLFASDYPTFLLIQFISGTGFAFASGSVSAIVYNSLPEDERPVRMQRAWGRIGAAGHAASLVAYSLGGWIAADLSLRQMRITLFLGMLGVGIAALLSLFLHVHAPVEHAERPKSLTLIRSGWRSIRHNPDLQRLILFSLLTNTFGAYLLVFYQQYFLESDVPGYWFGLALGLGSLAAIGTQFHAWRLVPRFGSNRALLIVAIVPGLFYLAMAATRHPGLAIVLFIVQWGATQMAGPLFAGLFNKHVNDSARATSLSLISLISTIYVGLAGLGLGWLSERSLTSTFVLIGGVAILGCVLIREPDRETSQANPLN
jgi:MFS family permease